MLGSLTIYSFIHLPSHSVTFNNNFENVLLLSNAIKQKKTPKDKSRSELELKKDDLYFEFRLGELKAHFHP